MIKTISLCLMVLFVYTGCKDGVREEALQQREARLVQREQQLSMREKLVAIREEEILQMKQKMDSAINIKDSALVYNQQLIGRWNVKMTCTETTCPGSAVGDTKTETWDIGYENNLIVAKAIVSDKLVRVYTGGYDGNVLTLTENVPDTPSEPTTKMTIRLTLTGNETMDGRREIVRENECKIVYDLQLNKLKPTTPTL